MTTVSHYALRLRSSPLNLNELRVVEEEGTTLNQFINVAEKQAARQLSGLQPISTH